MRLKGGRRWRRLRTARRYVELRGARRHERLRGALRHARLPDVLLLVGGKEAVPRRGVLLLLEAPGLRVGGDGGVGVVGGPRVVEGVVCVRLACCEMLVRKMRRNERLGRHDGLV